MWKALGSSIFLINKETQMDIDYYHFHLYYQIKDIELASRVRDKISHAFDLKVGRLWDRPVGPHPVGSCQITVPTNLFGKIIEWFLKNRDGVDLFIHPITFMPM